MNEQRGRRTNSILAKINRHMLSYGYQLIDLPIIDSADLFLVKAGDQIINSLFTFDRQGKQLALRPEFTAPAADYFAKTHGDPVARWQFAGSVFEDKSHELSTEFEQLGVGAELIGLGGSLAEAEIIAMSASGLRKLGAPNVHITIGHIGLIREIIQQFQLDIRTQRFLLHHIPALNDPSKGVGWILNQFDTQFSSGANRPPNEDDVYPHFSSSISPPSSSYPLAMGGRTQEDISRRLKLKQQRYADRKNVAAAVELLRKWCQLSGDPHSTFTHLSELVAGNGNAVRLLEAWQEVIALLEAHGIALSTVTIKPDLARSWEYYTGIVFELHSDSLHIGGGGRYDELARLVGSKMNTPSVGFAYYGNQLMEALKDAPCEVEPIVTITYNETDVINAATWANALRGRGISVQILPQSMRPTLEKLDIHLENAMIVQFQTSKYPFDHIDQLINDLKQTYK